jgi:hypothetical protein
MRNEYKILVGKPERKKPLGIPRDRWENIKMNVREIRCENMDCIYLPAQAVVNMGMKLQIS